MDGAHGWVRLLWCVSGEGPVRGLSRDGHDGREGIRDALPAILHLVNLDEEALADGRRAERGGVKAGDVGRASLRSRDHADHGQLGCGADTAASSSAMA